MYVLIYYKKNYLEELQEGLASTRNIQEFWKKTKEFLGTK